jgi:hypothetical protein
MRGSQIVSDLASDPSRKTPAVTSRETHPAFLWRARVASVNAVPRCDLGTRQECNTGKRSRERDHVAAIPPQENRNACAM